MKPLRKETSMRQKLKKTAKILVAAAAVVGVATVVKAKTNKVPA